MSKQDWTPRDWLLRWSHAEQRAQAELARREAEQQRVRTLYERLALKP